jgi:hypothetical protein
MKMISNVDLIRYKAEASVIEHINCSLSDDAGPEDDQDPSKHVA